MYNVSAAYIEKLKSVSIKRRRIRGRVDNLTFTENDLLSASFKYSDIAVSSADIKLGGVFVGSLQLTFLDSFAARIPRGTWRGKVIECSVGLQVNQANNTWEDVPLKPFFVDEANHTALGVEITAYDAMSKFDKAISFDQSSGTLYGFAELACRMCGVTLGMTEQEMQALPNGTELLGVYPTGDVETWRDFISWLAVTAGGFATINRSGELVIKTWSNTPVLEIDKFNRFSGGTWSDFSTNYSSLRVTHIETGTSMYYAVSPDNGLTLDIGANPLVQNGIEETYTRQRRAILTAIQNLKYVPFKSTSLIDPCLDLGDVISYTGGLADEESLCCVMRIDFSYAKGATLQGYGKNPALNNAKSKTDKAISAISGKGGSEELLTYYTYTNGTAITAGTTPVRIARLNFENTAQTTVTIHHELKMTNDITGETQTVKLRYFLDGVEDGYTPEDTYSEDDKKHLMTPFMWAKNIQAGRHTWEVRAEVDSGTAFFDIGDVRILLAGNKLSGEASWDGTIELAEEWPVLPLLQTIAAVQTRSLDVRMLAPRPKATLADVLVNVTPAQAMQGIQEGEYVDVLMFAPKFYFITESGDKMITEQDIDGGTGYYTNENREE